MVCYQRVRKGWSRRIIEPETLLIEAGGANKHYDQFGSDLDADVQVELAFWNQKASKLFLAHVPANPRKSHPCRIQPFPQPLPGLRRYRWRWGHWHPAWNRVAGKLGDGWAERRITDNAGSPDRNPLTDINCDGKHHAVVGFEAISRKRKGKQA